MGLTFTGTNERKLTKQKSFSFLLENCSVNNLTGSADFGFKDSSNQIKFTFDDGNIYDFDGRNCFSYIEDEKFTISGDFSDTKYTYKINDNLIAQGKSKTSFNIENFFLNTTGCTVSVDNLKINSDGLLFIKSLTLENDSYRLNQLQKKGILDDNVDQYLFGQKNIKIIGPEIIDLFNDYPSWNQLFLKFK